MATHRIPILGAHTLPDTSGNVFFEPYPVKATNDFWDYAVVVFNDTSTELVLHGKFDVPQNYVGSAEIKVHWTSTPLTGAAVWDFNYRAIGGDDSESLDQATSQESVTVTDGPPTAANNRLTATMTLTAGNIAAGDTLQFQFVRDGSSASDTLAAAATVHEIVFQYDDA